MRSRKVILLGCVVLALSILLSLPVFGKQVTLKFLWPAYTEAKIRYGEYLVKAFGKAHPDIKVDMILDTNPGQKLTVLTAAGSPPDVGWMGADWISFVDQDIFMPLDKFIERDKKEYDPDDFIPNVWSNYLWKGNMLMVPSGFTVSVMYYNKDLFDTFALVSPKDDWTWDQMVDAAKKLTRDTNGDGKIDVWGVELRHGSEWSVLNYSGRFFSQDGAKCSFNTPGFIWGLKAFRDLSYVHKVQPPSADVNALGGYQPMWLKGALGMYLGGSWALEPTRKGADFDWDVVPMPRAFIGGKEHRGTFFGPEGFFVHAQTKYPGEAWEFVKFATGKEITEWAAKEGHIVPGRNSAGPAFVRSGQKPRNMRAFLMSAAFGVPWGAHPAWRGEIFPVVWPIITDQLYGVQPKMSPEAAAQEIQRLAQGILDKWVARSGKK